jgi:hypothetical protein
MTSEIEKLISEINSYINNTEISNINIIKLLHFHNDINSLIRVNKDNNLLISIKEKIDKSIQDYYKIDFEPNIANYSISNNITYHRNI